METTGNFQSVSEARREDLEFEVLGLLVSERGITQRELAGRLGASLGRVNYCLRAMISAGTIRRVALPSARTGMFQGHEPTAAGTALRAALAAPYLQRKQAELERLAMQIEQVQQIAARS